MINARGAALASGAGILGFAISEFAWLWLPDDLGLALPFAGAVVAIVAWIVLVIATFGRRRTARRLIATLTLPVIAGLALVAASPIERIGPRLEFAMRRHALEHAAQLAVTERAAAVSPAALQAAGAVRVQAESGYVAFLRRGSGMFGDEYGFLRSESAAGVPRPGDRLFEQGLFEITPLNDNWYFFHLSAFGVD